MTGDVPRVHAPYVQGRLPPGLSQVQWDGYGNSYWVQWHDVDIVAEGAVAEGVPPPMARTASAGCALSLVAAPVGGIASGSAGGLR
jgi:hypothetical protein